MMQPCTAEPLLKSDAHLTESPHYGEFSTIVVYIHFYNWLEAEKNSIAVGLNLHAYYIFRKSIAGHGGIY